MTVTTAQDGTTTGTQNSTPASSLIANKRKPRSISSGSADLDVIFDTAGRKFNISPNLLKAIAKVESNFKADLVSKSGAMGVMQLMPGTAKYMGVDDPFDPVQNIMGAARYLREQLDRFNGNVEHALAAYNAGWPAVTKHGGIPPIKRTQAYVPKVLSYISNGEYTAGMATYNGFSTENLPKRKVKTEGISDVKISDKTTFNFNEALAQMLFIKLIEMQMTSHTDKSKTGARH